MSSRIFYKVVLFDFFMAKKRSSDTLDLTFSTRKLKRMSPWRALGIVGLIVLIGFIALWLLHVIVYGLALIGLVYVFYLFLQKRK